MSIPILRWPGGKRRALPEILKRLPKKYGCLHEPFVGGGALTFDLEPSGGFISDLNSELTNFYTVLKQNPKALTSALLDFELSQKAFYDLRAQDRSPEFKNLDPAWRAARYLFINRTCFNGMMRVNARGQLNCSYGSPIIPSRVYETKNIDEAHKALRSVRIYESSYEGIENRVQTNAPIAQFQLCFLFLVSGMQINIKTIVL